MCLTCIDKNDFQELKNKVDELKETIESYKKKQPLDDIWLENKDVMDLLGISARTLVSMRSSNSIAFSKLGGKIYYKSSDISAMLNKNYIKAN